MTDTTANWRQGEMRVMYVAYLGLIFFGLIFFFVTGLRHA
jgi:hypothetical protein